MSVDRSFSGIAVLIPGYSVDDIPTDLNEVRATGLLNAIACAWHPAVIAAAGEIPQFRYADVSELMDSGLMLFVPDCSEDWLGHDWKSQLEAGNCHLFHGLTERDEWLQEIDRVFDADADPVTPDVVADFLALGLSWYLVMALSRRMHYYIDPDETKLSSAVREAATAALEGRDADAKQALGEGFECMLETREQLFPVETWLLDLCLLSGAGDDAQLQESVTTANNVSLMISPAELETLKQQQPGLYEQMTAAVDSGRCSFVSGGWHELRSSLGTLASAYSDLQRSLTVVAGKHRVWGQRRFGLLHSMPALLELFDFRFALHFALDDGIYPEREVGLFDWTGPGTGRIQATSRLPVAIDSAASFLRLPERLAESIQQDSAAVMLFARLPTLATGWLSDLRRIHDHCPLLGRFVTLAELCEQSEPSTESVRFRAGEYLSPSLIQASVLKTEAPVTGPADLHRCRHLLERLAFLHALTGILSPSADQPVPVQELEQRLNDEEHGRLSTDMTCDLEAQRDAVGRIESRITLQTAEQIQQLAELLPTGSSDGLLVINALPFAREVTVHWPAEYQPPVASDAVQSLYRQQDDLYVRVKTPPGGFVQLTESGHETTAASIGDPGGRPLAEDGLLRNQCFEVILSPATGGIADVRFHGQRANRVSQQVAFRYESPKTIPAADSNDVLTTSWAATSCEQLRVISSGPWLGAVESQCVIRDVVDGQELFRFRQVTQVERTVPRITVAVYPDADSAASISGNPWMTYLACRFAWDNEAAAISRSLLGQICGFQGERFEAPDFIEVADEDQRLLIIPHGRPYHRRSGPRMLDSLLLVEGQPVGSDAFVFTVAFDVPHPQRVASDVLQPVVTQSVSGVTDAAAWVLGCTSKNVQLARVRRQGRVVTVLLAETDGRPVACQLRCARPPEAACTQKATGTVLEPLETDDTAVAVRFEAFEMKEVRLTF